MIQNKRFFSKYKGFQVGPGGLRCACCAPPAKARKKLFKIGKKRMESVVRKIERDDE